MNLGLLLLVTLVPDLTARPEILIDATALAKMLSSAKPVVLDARSPGKHRRAHLPGARHVDVSAWVKLAHSKGGLVNAAAWARLVGTLGIDGKRPVVVYGDSAPGTARVWWTLKYLGVKNVRVLDGEWSAWQASRGPTESRVAAVTAVTFVPKFQKDRLAEIDTVRKAIKSDKFAVLDARSDGEFRSGRIPGAAHLEWKRFIQKDGRYKKPAEIRKLLEACGITRGKVLVPY